MSQKVRQSHVIYNLTEHCNLSCYGCDHNSPAMPEKFAELADFERDLRALATAMELGTVYFVGGEPLLHPALPAFLRVARAVGIAERVGIVTNGVLLHTVPDETWDLIDVIHLTRYPGVRLRIADEALIERCRERDIALRIETTSGFRHTLLNAVMTDAARIQTIYDACQIAHVIECRTVYEGRYYKCSPAPFIPQRLRQLGMADAAAGWEADGVLLHGNPDLAAALAAYLADATPLASCAACLGTSGKMAAHQQMNRAATAAWLAEDHRDAERLIDEQHLIRHRGRDLEVEDRTHVQVYSSDEWA